MTNLASFDLNRLLEGPTVPVMLCTMMWALVLIVWTIGVQWRRVRIAEADASLKARMIERGFTAAEVERVLAASTDPRNKRGRDSRFVTHAQTCCG